MFIYLENQPFCSWWRIPIHSWPWSADNCPTPYQFFHPLTPTHRSSYNVYIDDINNTSRPRLAQLLRRYLECGVFRMCLAVYFPQSWEKWKILMDSVLSASSKFCRKYKRQLNNLTIASAWCLYQGLSNNTTFCPIWTGNIVPLSLNQGPFQWQHFQQILN
jgi:hypothetical protein